MDKDEFYECLVGYKGEFTREWNRSSGRSIGIDDFIESCDDVFTVIKDAFDWDYSHRGREYWLNVCMPFMSDNYPEETDIRPVCTR